MAQVSFLQADIPLTKNYSVRRDGTVEKEAYPNAYKFTSSTHDVNGIEGLHKAIVSNAAKDFCLVKGQLHKKLSNEPRAGATDPFDSTEWICFDLDKVQGISTPDEFLALVGMQDVSYVVQYSSSYGVEFKDKLLDERLSCHIFVWLDKPVAAKMLKQWLIHLNFTTPVLQDELRLTNSMNGLSYPLDVTTCQNDKLLYISPPKLQANAKLVDVLAKGRIKLVKRKKLTAKINEALIPPKSKNQTQINAKVDELRKAEGLEARRKVQLKHDIKTNLNYLPRPDVATVTGVKHDRGFVYLNLNGGDSWGYYFPEDNPEIVRNFKGEPNFLLKELAPDFYANYKQALASSKNQNQEEATVGNAQQQRETGRYYLAFRDFETSNYFNGWYDRDTDELVLKLAKNENQLRSFYKQYGLEMGEFVPDWHIVYDPSSQETLTAEKRTVNLYKPSPFEYVDVDRKPKPTPAIERVTCHMLGIEDISDPLYPHWFNWLACMIQLKRSVGSAWVLQGTQSTGKGTMFNRVIKPLLGAGNVVTKESTSLESQFNGWMENIICAFIDETHLTNLIRKSNVNQKLKSWIGEPTIDVRELYKPSRNLRNFISFIFASNEIDALHLPANDRRFNVGNFQYQKLHMTDQVLAQIEGELEDYYISLMQHKIDENAGRTPLHTDARQELMETSRVAIDTLGERVMTGDLLFFFDQLPDDESKLPPIRLHKLGPYKDTLQEWLDNCAAGKPHLTRDQLQLVYEWCLGGMPESPWKFSNLVKHHGVHIKQVFYLGKLVQGVSMRWQPLDDATVTLLRERLNYEGPLGE